MALRTARTAAANWVVAVEPMVRRYRRRCCCEVLAGRFAVGTAWPICSSESAALGGVPLGPLRSRKIHRDYRRNRTVHAVMSCTHNHPLKYS
jgi:hypothetical protein